MSFRFQKRVRIAPGVRLNISKRGVSASVGPRGASMTMGRNGLYGNVGIPGSGMSYRRKLDKKTGRTSIEMTKGREQTLISSIQLVYRHEENRVEFVTEDGQTLPQTLERRLKKEFHADIQQIYREKEQEINEQTEQLLQLQHQTFPPLTFQEIEAKIDAATSLNEMPPNESHIFQELLTEQQSQLTAFEKMMLIFPRKKKNFQEKVRLNAMIAFKEQMANFQEKKLELEEENQVRKYLLNSLHNGDKEKIEEWLELHLPELDFPLETNVGIKAMTKDMIYIDVDLPELKDIPFTKAEILKSGKLKVVEKSQRETREHFATVVGGTALYLCSFVFAFVPVCKTIAISGYTQVLNETTGHKQDKYIYSLLVDRERFYSLNMKQLNPIAAFENFDPRVNVTKTFLFKEIEPYDPEELIHDTEQ